MKTPFHEIEHANEYDRSVMYRPAFRNALANKYVRAQFYSQQALYDNMLHNKTAVYQDYPMQPTRVFGESTRDYLIRVLKEGLPKNEKIMIRTGETRTLKRVTIQETIDRWIRGRSKFGVTDLHFRDTKFYDKVDAHAISYFNLLPQCPYEVSFLEMMTLVISSKGIYSDSHSDDGDGSNHCFVGKKLWLAWDRTEGQKNGLQDCTHDNVFDKARFDMKKFIALKSAHWFTVSDNQTLFMPGNFTHKVITLDPYIGFGSFYVSLPGYMNTLKRWILQETGDVK